MRPSFTGAAESRPSGPCALPNSSLALFCMAYDEFPHGKTIDYERKFVYWLTSEQ